MGNYQWVDYSVCTFLVGAGATMLMDIWLLIRKRVLGVPSQSYGLVGRWLVYMTRGQFRHDSIAATPSVRNEQWVGWIAHYLTGIAFAAVLLGIWTLDWVRHPTLAPALIVGIATVVAPFLLMQPGMGAGIAASRTKNPALARFHSVLTHSVFGLGLYAAGFMARALWF